MLLIERVAIMAQTQKSIRQAYNNKTYREFKIRVRRNSDLCVAMESTLSKKGASLNFIVTKLLADFYDVSFPESFLDNDA